MARPRTPLGTRFLAKIGEPTSTGCIPWLACLDKDGYGLLFDLDRGNHRPAHCIAWELARGAIPPGSCVLHSCDNPTCVNVVHLFLGSQAANMADKVAKGRSNAACGERNHSKLTAAQVSEIRRRYATAGVSQTSLAREFGVDQSTVCNIVRRKIWKCLP